MRTLFPLAALVACSSPDAQIDAAPPLDAALCDQACQTNSARVMKGDQGFAIERAVFGFNGAAAAPSSARIELYHGAAPGCPTMDTPTPKATLIVANIPITSGAFAPNDSTAKTSLLDFAGLVTQSPIVRSTTVSLTNIVGMTSGERFVAFDVSAMLAEGISLSGHVYATHCPSLDAAAL